MPTGTSPGTTSAPRSAPSVKERFSWALGKRTAKLQEVHDAVGREYDPEQFEQLEFLLYNIGSWFNHALRDEGWPYWHWVNRSEECQKRMKNIVEQFNEASYCFQHADAQQFSRAKCRRALQNLIISINNLRRYNDGRSE